MLNVFFGYAFNINVNSSRYGYKYSYVIAQSLRHVARRAAVPGDAGSDTTERLH